MTLFKSKRFLIFALVVLAAAAITTAVYAATKGASDGGVAVGTATPNASISIRNCKVPKVDFITNDNTGLGTTSTTYVPVPGMTTTISIAGTASTCIVVNAAAFAFAQGAGHLEYVSVTLDGNLCNPTETQFAAEDSSLARAHAFLCAFPSVTPGSHSVALVFRSLDGSQVFIHRPSMSIEHK